MLGGGSPPEHTDLAKSEHCGGRERLLPPSREKSHRRPQFPLEICDKWLSPLPPPYLKRQETQHRPGQAISLSVTLVFKALANLSYSYPSLNPPPAASRAFSSYSEHLVPIPHAGHLSRCKERFPILPT